MRSFVPGTGVTLTFDMVNPNTGDPINPSAASFKVYDEEGVELIGSLPVTVSGNETELDVTVPAAYNTLGTETVAARTVLLSVTETGLGQVMLTQTYVLEGFQFLQVPSESAMTLAQSMIFRSTLAQTVLDAWDYAEDRERQSALREAWSRLSMFRYSPWRSYETIPDALTDNVRNGDFHINAISAVDWALLPDHFHTALKRAQLIEAAVILEGDPTWDRRQDGLISKTVGESSEMFTSKKAAVTDISPRSHREIKPYIVRTISIGRG